MLINKNTQRTESNTMAQQHPSDVKIPGRYIGSCAICLHAMNANSTGIDQVTVLRCGHYFHTCCYNQAVRAAPEQKCPACRKDLTGFTVLPADGPTIEQQNHQRGLQERKTPEDYVKDRVETLKQQIQKAKNESKIREFCRTRGSSSQALEHRRTYGAEERPRRRRWRRLRSERESWDEYELRRSKTFRNCN